MPKVVKAGLRVEVDTDAMNVTVSVKEGKEVKDSETFDWADLPVEIQSVVQLKGLSTILQQRASDVKEDPLAKLDMMREVFSMFAEGQYEKDRKVGARVVAPIIEVLAGLANAETSVIQKSWSKLSDEHRAELEKKYEKEIEAVKAKRAKAEEVDLSSFI